MRVLVALLALLCAALVAAQINVKDDPHYPLFKEFVYKYDKQYSTAEELWNRFAVFKANLARVEELNKQQPSARFGMTKFADLTAEEFKARYLMKNFKATPEAVKAANLLSLNTTNVAAIPDTYDWRDHGAVTHVKDQGQCGSCWAFSATEAIESQWFLAGNALTALSEQQIVDCDKGRGDEGCNGGDTPTAYQYVVSAGGLEGESAYPYTAEDDRCAFKSDKVVAKITGFNYVTKDKDESVMQSALVAKGPLSICVDAESWQLYVSGVITDMCGQALDHCVMITGYGNQKGWDQFTYKVWNIRNSWGEDWGYGGYLYVERGYNLCGVADEVTLPTV